MERGRIQSKFCIKPCNFLRMEKIKLGRYKHYKGREIKVIAIVKHSETLGELVLYEHTDEEKPVLWVRPKDMWFDKVEKGGKMIKRFEYIGQ